MADTPGDPSREGYSAERAVSRNATDETFYGTELSHVHHVGFTALAAGTAPALVHTLRAGGFEGGTVVELGCGSGVLAAALSEAGFAVVGVDRSPAMLRLARETAPRARFVPASLYDFEIPPCIAVFAIGEGLSYIGKEDPREALPGLFSRVHQALTPGGFFVFDLVLTSRRKAQRYTTRRTGPGWSVSVDVEEFSERSLLVRRIRTTVASGEQQRRSSETHRVRTFSRIDVEAVLRAAGFSVRVRRSYGAVALGPFRLAFLARKPIARSDGPSRVGAARRAPRPLRRPDPSSG